MIKIGFNDNDTMNIGLTDLDKSDSSIYRVDEYEGGILKRALLSQFPRDKFQYPITFEYMGRDTGDIVKIRDDQGVVLDYYKGASGLLFFDYLESIVYGESRKNRKVRYTVRKRWHHGDGVVLDVYHLDKKTHTIPNDLVYQKFCNFLNAKFGVTEFNIVEICEIYSFKFGVSVDCQSYCRVVELTNSEVMYLDSVLNTKSFKKNDQGPDENNDDYTYCISSMFDGKTVLCRYKDWRKSKEIEIQPNVSKIIFNLINDIDKRVKHDDDTCTTLYFPEDDTHIRIDGREITGVNRNVRNALYYLLNEEGW